jgi:hypothetical protein
MEQQYFLGGLLKKGLSFGKSMVSKAARAGAKFAASHLKNLPISGLLQKATGLLGKNLTDTLMRLAQSASPGGAIGIPALQALGIIPGGATSPPADGASKDSETWERFSEFAREVYETAADQTNEATLNPLGAIQQARSVINNVVRQNKGVVQRASGMALGAARGVRHRRVVRVRPGEAVLVVCK